MPMAPVHRLAHQADRPDGGVEWACAQCGHYRVCYPQTEVVVIPAAPDTVHVPGCGFPPQLDGPPSLSTFDQQFLRHHAMTW
jgi:hypothetical protein